MSPKIISPMNGAVVTAPFTVEATYGDIDYCDTGGCHDVPAVTISLSADPDTDYKEIGSCKTATECPGGMATFEVSLAPGKHVLQVIASDDFFSIEISETIEITVEAASTTGDTGGVTTGDTSGATDAATDGSGATSNSDSTDSATGGGTKDEGCGCRSASGSGAALSWLAALGLLGRRRRRSPR